MTPTRRIGGVISFALGDGRAVELSRPVPRDEAPPSILKMFTNSTPASSAALKQEHWLPRHLDLDF